MTQAAYMKSKKCLASMLSVLAQVKIYSISKMENPENARKCSSPLAASFSSDLLQCVQNRGIPHSLGTTLRLMLPPPSSSSLAAAQG